jgi:branched-chain amino acid aminotransferase
VKQLIYYDGTWSEEQPLIMGPTSQAVWMATAVFDGTRVLAGVGPDLDRHCQRCIASAEAMGLEPPLDAEGIEALIWEGVAKFPPQAQLFIRPMLYPEDGFVLFDPSSTRFTLTLMDLPLAKPTGFSACLSSFRRPGLDMAITSAKAACLYPNAIRAVREARVKGFDTAIMLDGAGHVAEFATANLFIARDGAVHTPVPNGTFLNGITRQRVIALLRGDGVEVAERSLPHKDVLAADEVFSTGNLDKVVPVSRVDDRDFQPGPLFQRARSLYFNWADREGRRAPA